MLEKPVKSSQISMYGNTCIEKAYCSSCKKYAFVLDGELQCCDTPVETVPTTLKRESEPWFKRIHLANADKDAILSNQDYRCFYCERPIGSTLFRKGKAVRLKVEYDHVTPFVFNADNKLPNFVAACHICNGHKSSKIFSSVDEAKIYLINRQKEKGYYE